MIEANLKRLVFYIFLVVLFSACQKSSNQHPQVCFKDTCFHVEIVHEESEIQKGLQGRHSLGKDEGMLFVFSSSAIYTFWMKDTLIPLDMIWLDYAHKIVHIEKNVLPCQSDPCPTYQPKMQALYVLEINAGLADTYQMALGDYLEFKLE